MESVYRESLLPSSMPMWRATPALRARTRTPPIADSPFDKNVRAQTDINLLTVSSHRGPTKNVLVSRLQAVAQVSRPYL